MSARRFSQFLSVDSAKAIKAQSFGYLNGINYMSPASTGGFGNLCSHASSGCLALCLGWYSGQAAYVADLENDVNAVRQSRKDKVAMFMNDRATFMIEMVAAIEALIRKAKRMGMRPCCRPNGATDIAWEGIKCTRNGVEFRNVFEAFPEVDFVDYTKNPIRMRRALPANYHLTFSRSETNEADCINVLANGGNVAVVFAGDKPTTWQGFPVIDGDEHDLRQLDPKGHVVALSPKGSKAKRDVSGFVVRNLAA